MVCNQVSQEMSGLQQLLSGVDHSLNYLTLGKNTTRSLIDERCILAEVQCHLESTVKSLSSHSHGDKIL